MATSQNQYSKYKKTIANPFTVGVLKSHTAYLELTLSFFAIIFFGWFALRPTFTTIVDLVNQINAKKEVVQQLDQKIDSLIAADTTYKTAEDRLFLLDEALPVEHESALFLAQLETLAVQSGVEIDNLNYSTFPLDKTTPLNTQLSSLRNRNLPGDSTAENQNQPEWRVLEFDLSITGDYPQLRETILGLYQLRRLVLTQNVNISPESVNSRSLTLRLTGQVLYY